MVRGGGGLRPMLDWLPQSYCRQLARSELDVGVTKIRYMRRYMAGVMGQNEVADFGLVIDSIGGSGGTRTLDQRIKSPLL